MAFTVTATESGSSAQQGMVLTVRVLTGATEAGGATAGSATATGAASSGSLTPNATNSFVGFAVSGDNFSAVMPAAAANNTYDQNTGDSGLGWSSAHGHYTGTVTAATPLTYGAGSAGSGQDHGNWCAYEVKSSGGSTPAVDGSSPAGVHDFSNTFVATGSFTPPAGAVLLAMVTAGGTGSGTGITVAITDTSGLSLSWTPRAVSSASDNYQPTFIFTAAIPGAVVPGVLAPTAAKPGASWRRVFHHEQLRPQVVAAPAPPRSPWQPYAQPGQAWKSRYHMPQRPKPPAPFHPPYITGLGGVPGAGWFTDNLSQRVFALKDDIWGLITNAGRWSGTYQSDIDACMSTRAGQGFTTILVSAIGTAAIGAVNDTGNSWDGVAPFTTPWSALNNTYWTRIDYLLAAAQRAGITICLQVMFTYALDNASNVMHGITGAGATAYGTALGNRYKNTPNLIWMFGDDYTQSYPTQFQNCIDAIHATGDTHLASIENSLTGSTSRYDISSPGNTIFGWGGTYASFNWCYEYAESYFCVEYTYGEAAPLIPSIYADGMYWGEVAGGNPTANDNAIRQNQWWAISSGARGFGTGDATTHHWQSTWATDLLDGSWYTAWAGNIRKYVQGLTGWHALIPDTGSVLVTAGRGTRATYNGSAFQGYVSANTYVTASRVADGSLAVIYLPAATTITIDQSKMAAGYTATWVDPATCATQAATPGTTYNSTALGNNSTGNPDWVLVLQGASSGGASVTGAAAPVTVAAPAGVAFGGTGSTPANVTGGPAAVAVASPAGTVSSAASVTGTPAPVTAAGPAGTTASAANVTGTGAAVTTAAPAGVPSSAASVTGTAAPVTVASPAGVAAGSGSGAANITGVAAPVTVASPAGVLAGSVNVTGIAAPVTVACPAGTPSGGGAAAGVAAPVTVACPAGALAGSGNVTGLAAPVTVACPAGVLSTGASITGTAAAITVTAPAGAAFGGTSGAANIAGAAAAVTVASPAGVPHAASALTGTSAPLTAAAPAGTPAGSGPVNVTGIAAHITAASPAGTTAGSANVTGTGAPVLTAAPAGTLAAAANLTGLAALATVLGGPGGPLGALPFTVGTLTASGTPTGVLTAVTAAGGSGGVLTASDTKTGGPG